MIDLRYQTSILSYLDFHAFLLSANAFLSLNFTLEVLKSWH
jgi:hypothetical protein